MEGARSKAVKNFDRYTKIRTLLIKHRVNIEQELMKDSKGHQPPPHIVMDRLIKLDDEIPTDEDLMKLSSRKSPPRKEPKSPQFDPASKLDQSFYSNPDGFYSVRDPVVQSAREQAHKLDKLKDWANTPIYKFEMQGETQLQSVITSVPEDEILKLTHLSRDKEEPHCFGNRVLLDMTLKKAATLTELQYWFDVLRKRDLPDDEL